MAHMDGHDLVAWCDGSLASSCQAPAARWSSEAYREAKRLACATHEQVGEWVGRSAKWAEKLAAGERTPSEDEAHAIARQLDVRPGDLEQAPLDIAGIAAWLERTRLAARHVLLEGHSVEEISTALGVSWSTASTWIATASQPLDEPESAAHPSHELVRRRFRLVEHYPHVEPQPVERSRQGRPPVLALVQDVGSGAHVARIGHRVYPLHLVDGILRGEVEEPERSNTLPTNAKPLPPLP
jgi:DNA-binding transcriptional ArsR family regulator